MICRLIATTSEAAAHEDTTDTAAVLSMLGELVHVCGGTLHVEASRVVITWSSVPLYSSSSFSIAPIQNFQVRLYPDGKIEIAYRSTAPQSAVVGITQGGATSTCSSVVPRGRSTEAV